MNILKKCIIIVILFVQAGCNNNIASKTSSPWNSYSVNKIIRVEGSSTVYPISKLIGHLYSKQNDNIVIDVSFSGTGDGFKQLCTGKIDIINASRPVKKYENEMCISNEIEYIELPIAFDAICVVVNPAQSWVDSLTVNQLRKMWEKSSQGTINNWNQIDPSFPNKPFRLYGPGKESGTYDYFTKAVLGKEGTSREDYFASEDDQLLADKLIEDESGVAFFGLSHYLNNSEKLKALKIDDELYSNGTGPIFPDEKNVIDASYQPLSRPLFIYVSIASAEKPHVNDFVQYYLSQASAAAKQSGYVPLTEELYQNSFTQFTNRITGSAFGTCGSKIGVTISNLTELTLEELMDTKVHYRESL